MLGINPVSHNNPYITSVPFKKSDKQPENEIEDNPISRKGETMNLIKATFIGGLVVGAKLFFELVYDDADFVFEKLGSISKATADKKLKEMDKAKKDIKGRRAVYAIGAYAALLAAGLCGFALLYTAYNAPKISYESKVNAFKKGREMDVYVKANTAEKELYEQLDEKAKVSTKEEKDALKVQYLKMQNAKNQVPDYVKLKNMPKIESKN